MSQATAVPTTPRADTASLKTWHKVAWALWGISTVVFYALAFPNAATITLVVLVALAAVAGLAWVAYHVGPLGWLFFSTMIDG